MAEERVNCGADAPRWLSADEQLVWRAYLDVSRLLNEKLSRQLAEADDLSMAEYEILVQLSELPERQLRMAELAERAVNSRSRLTHTVGRMEQRGLVRRDPCRDDGRGVECTLTDAGLAAIEDAAPGHVEAVRQMVFDPLCAGEVERFGAALEKIREALRRG
jgi:DNA-binding MarR family transcriptional regulator